MENETTESPASPSQFHGQDTAPALDVAVDLDTQTGVKSPPPKRVKLSESPSPPPSPSYEFLDENGEDSAESEADSEDSFILDLFHAEGSGESSHGITDLELLLK
jgi:hypothetical protein